MGNDFSNNQSVRKVLITGGAGFIGSAIVKRFIDDSAEVHIVDNLSTGLLSNLPVHPNLIFHRGSVLDQSFLIKISSIPFDLIVSLASVVGMRLATVNKSLSYDTSVTGNGNLITVFPDTPLVLLSSSAVYGFNSIEPMNEKRKIDRDHLLEFDGGVPGYACGKLDAELILLKESAKGRKVMILRPFNIIGNLQLSDFGMVVPTLIRQALKNEPLTVFGDGNQIRSFSSLDTFVTCLFQLLNFEDLWRPDQNIINVGVDFGCSINELATIIIKQTQSKSEIVYVPYTDIYDGHIDVRCRIPNTDYVKQYCKNLIWPDLKMIIKDIAAHHKNVSGN